MCLCSVTVEASIAWVIASEHHAPNREEVIYLIVLFNLKRSVKEHPEAAPAQIFRNDLQVVVPGVLSESLDRSNLRKQQRERH